MKDLFEYFSYHEFLTDYVAEMKSSKEWFSLRYFANKIGMDQGNMVKIFQGQRHLSKKVVERLISYLNLDGRQGEYLRTLVEFNKAKNDNKAKQLFENLMSIIAPDPKLVAPDQYEFYKKWYYTAVYVLLDCYEFSGDYVQLANLVDPPITLIQAKESIQLLLRLKIVQRREDGRFVQTHNLMYSGSDWRSIAVHIFQETTLKLALQSLQNHNRDVRDFSTLSMSINSEDLGKVRELTKEYRKSLLKIVQESEPANCVYHLNMQLFPMSKTKVPKR